MDLFIRRTTLLVVLFLLTSASLLAQNCDVTEVKLRTSEPVTCNGDGTYDLKLLVKGVDLPADDSDAKVIVAGQERPIKNYSLRPNGNVRITVGPIPNENIEDVEVFVRVESGCTKTASALYNEPEDCEAPPSEECDITGVFLVHTQPLFDEDNTYILCILFTAHDLPQGQFGLLDKIIVEAGENQYKFFNYPYHFQGIGPDGQEIYRWCVQLPCGTEEGVDIFFSAESGCTLTMTDAYNEPGEPGCRPEAEARLGDIDLSQVVLENAFPNPFSHQTEINFSLPAEMNIRLKVMNSIGQEVRILHNGMMAAGLHRMEFDGKDNSGNSLPGGIYFLRLEGGSKILDTKKLMLRK